MNPAAPTLRLPRLLLTGAAGHLGRELRPRLRAYCDVLRLSDCNAVDPAQAHEEVMPSALENAPEVMRLLEGVDAVVHLGGISTEQAWAPILASNIVGMVNLYEAARLQGVRRIVYASSNHVTGFYRQDERIDTRAPHRPDGFYGLSKAFGEDLAQLYWDRWQIETVSLRIGSSYALPRDRRMLASWLSFDDLERLIVAALSTAAVGHTVVYGVSDNSASWWDNRHAQHLGYQPQDSADAFRAQVEAQHAPLPADDPAHIYQGGAFVKARPHG